MEHVDVAWAHDGEVCAVQRQDLPHVEAFGDGADAGAGVSGSQWQVRVALDQFGRAFEVIAGARDESNDPTAIDRRNAASAAGVARVDRK